MSIFTDNEIRRGFWEKTGKVLVVLLVGLAIVYGLTSAWWAVDQADKQENFEIAKHSADLINAFLLTPEDSLEAREAALDAYRVWYDSIRQEARDE